MPSTKRSASVELLVSIDRESGEPLHRQLEAHVRDSVRSGRLAAGATMPSSRALAGQLGLARGVVVEAYEQLIAEGYLVSRPGGSTKVADLPAQPAREPVDAVAPGDTIHLRAGRPDVSEFPRAAWGRSARRILNETPADRFTYLGGEGVLELRAALAEHLGRARGAAAHADDIVICNGFMQGLHLVGRALVAGGARRIGLEEPYDDIYRLALDDLGLEVVPIEVDDDGVRVDQVAIADLDAMVVTPAHQFPTGAVLAPDRRAALLAWARARQAVIVEDDYDAEFRYDREPIGALQGLDPERVVYAGTASKSIAPGLRLGWLLAPTRLAAGLADIKNRTDHGTAAFDQLVLADIIRRGELDRHLRHMRSIYRRRRDTLIAALERELPRWRVLGASAGLHLTVLLPGDVDEARLLAGAEAEGVEVYGLSRYRSSSHGPGGIVFGYGEADEAAVETAVATLARVAAGIRR